MLLGFERSQIVLCEALALAVLLKYEGGVMLNPGQKRACGRGKEGKARSALDWRGANNQKKSVV